jgi:FkbM family methyltransferase
MNFFYSKNIPKRVVNIGRTIKRILYRNPDKFLNDISGVVHVGANIGQERKVYSKYGLSVIWVEPIPYVFENLVKNISEFENQLAFQALLTDSEDEEIEFHIANNNGASSSIFNLKHHKEIWPEVEIKETIKLNTTTLSSLLKKEKIDLSKYQALILDTQGSELLILKGSIPILKQYKYIKLEVADFESYEGCCQLDDILKFMNEFGYYEYSRIKFAKRKKGGNYYDIIFKKNDINTHA